MATTTISARKTLALPQSKTLKSALLLPLQGVRGANPFRGLGGLALSAAVTVIAIGLGLDTIAAISAVISLISLKNQI